MRVLAPFTLQSGFFVFLFLTSGIVLKIINLSLLNEHKQTVFNFVT